MRKILSLIAIVLLFVSCGSKQPQKTPEQIKAESIAAFKQKATNSIENYLKRNISSDPDYGRVIETSETSVNDSMYIGHMRVAIKNVFGAVQQKDGCIFCFCKKGNSYFLKLWDSNADFAFDYGYSSSGQIDLQSRGARPSPLLYKFVVEHGEEIN